MNQRPFCFLPVCRYWREILAGTQQTSPGKPDSKRTDHRAQFLRARFYHSTKFRLSAQFVLRESCWGCHPKPAFLRLAPLEKSPKNFFGFFKKHFRFAPCFSPISERAKHKKKGVEAYEKILKCVE